MKKNVFSKASDIPLETTDQYFAICQWVPAELKTMLTAASVTAVETNCTGVTTEKVVFYLSTNSGCYGSYNADSGTPGCTAGNFSTNNTFAVPTSVGDLTKGMKLIAPTAGATTYRMIVDPDLIVGFGGTCRLQGAPKFSFVSQ